MCNVFHIVIYNDIIHNISKLTVNDSRQKLLCENSNSIIILNVIININTNIFYLCLLEILNSKKHILCFNYFIFFSYFIFF